jgi:rubrerythrin
MSNYEDLTSLEALGIAIRSEIDAQNVYEDLAELCEDDLLKERFINLAQEEKKHRLLLEKLYSRMFPEVDLVLPQSQLPQKAINSERRKKLGLKDVLQIAIDEEERMFIFYDKLSKNVKDLSGQRMFKYIADIEYRNKMILEAENEILEKYPHYYGEIESWDAEFRLKAERIKRN